jgi:hypothetical protein
MFNCQQFKTPMLPTFISPNHILRRSNILYIPLFATIDHTD